MFAEDYVGNALLHQIIDHRLKTFAQQTAMQLYDPDLKKHVSFRFTGPLPVTVERKHVAQIKTGQYSFTPKADGIRALMVMFRYHIDNDWHKITVLIGRNGECHLVAGIHTTDEPCNNGGSLFDCEIVKKGSESVALIFDCYAFSGVSYVKHTLNRRYSRMQYFVDECYSKQPQDRISLEIKPYFRLESSKKSDFDAFMGNNHFLGYNTDGVIIVSAGKQTQFTNNNIQFKMKPEHTIDLVVIEDEGEVYLATYDESDDCYVTKQQIKRIPDGCQLNDIVECKMSFVNDIATFSPIMVRNDKTRPNTERVLELTINTVRDDVKFDDLLCK